MISPSFLVNFPAELPPERLLMSKGSVRLLLISSAGEPSFGNQSLPTDEVLKALLHITGVPRGRERQHR